MMTFKKTSSTIFLIAFGIFSNSQNLWSQDETANVDKKEEIQTKKNKLVQLLKSGAQKTAEYKNALIHLIMAIYLYKTFKDEFSPSKQEKHNITPMEQSKSSSAIITRKGYGG